MNEGFGLCNISTGAFDIDCFDSQFDSFHLDFSLDLYFGLVILINLSSVPKNAK